LRKAAGLDRAWAGWTKFLGGNRKSLH
jgi:hypothetical protein